MSSDINIEQQLIEESNHRSFHMGGKHSCQNRGKNFVRKNGLYIHQMSVHMDTKYACEQCAYQATQKSSLARHHQSAHMGEKHACQKRGNHIWPVIFNQYILL